MDSEQQSTVEPNAKGAATAVWFAQFPDDLTVPTTPPLKTTIWQKFSLSIIGAWQFILRVWAWASSRISVQAAWLRLKLWLHVHASWGRLGVPPTLRAWGLLTRFHASWDRLAVPPTLRAWGLLTEVDAVENRVWRWGWSMRWSRDFVVGIGFASVAVLAYHILSSTIRLSDTSPSWTQQRNCYQIMRSASVVQRFPLPYPVDDAVHKAILNRVGWTETEPLFWSLSDESSFVRSNLSRLLETGEEFARYLAYPYPDSDTSNPSLSSNIEDLLDRFHSTAAPIKASVELYNELEILYHKQYNIAEATFKRCQLHLAHSWLRTLIRYHPSALKRFGMDFNQCYGAPWQETLRIWEEARLGVAALDQESQRMKQIGYLIAAGKRILDQSATSLIQGDVQCKNNICRQERVRQWLGQAIVRNTSLKEVWDDISVSITDGEALLLINITDKWCDWAADEIGQRVSPGVVL